MFPFTTYSVPFCSTQCAVSEEAELYCICATAIQGRSND